MSPQLPDRDEALKSAVRVALQTRDHAARTPPFGRVWPAAETVRRPAAPWRPAFAAFATILVLAGVSWVYFARDADDGTTDAGLRETAALAQELSSPDYWRVPSDELLAFAAVPLDVNLPSPEGFNVSLEESLL
ncbi:MAG: hypothetical protein ACT4UP_00135 [Gammaproteobacteria bacterium]